MKPFPYERARTPAQAAAVVADKPSARFLAGGTNLLDLMKLEIETPAHLVDVQDLNLDRIEPTPEGRRAPSPSPTSTASPATPRTSTPTCRPAS